MALGALTLSVTQGVQGRPFQATINGLTTGRVEIGLDGSPGFSTVNGKVMSHGLPYPVSTVVLREYDPGAATSVRESRIEITAATRDQLRAQALASLGTGRTLRRYQSIGTRQGDGSIVYTLAVEDDLGATVALALDGGTPAPTPTVTLSATQSKAEGNSGATLYQYTVTRSASAGAVDVPWSFTAGGTNAADFTGGVLPAGGTVSMADGVASGTITISVNGDTVVEGDETFTVLISTPSGYVAGASTSATGTILNDDSAGYTFVNSEAQAFVARTNPSASNSIKAAYDGLVSDLKVGRTNGTNNFTGWDFLEVAGPDASFRDLLGNTARDATYSTGDVPTVSPLYGPTTNGLASYVEVPITPAACTYFTQDDCAFLVVNRNPDAKGSSATGIVGLAGTGSTSNSLSFNPRSSTTGANMRLNDGTATAMIAAGNVTDATGTHMGVRVTGGIKRYYKNGAKQGSDVSLASVARQSVNFRLGYALSTYQEDQYLVFGVGRSRTDAEAADIHAAVAQFKSAIGWAALTIVNSRTFAPSASAVQLPQYTAQANVTPGTTGLTITGFAKDLQDSAAWWVGDTGRSVASGGSPTYTPRLQKMNAARTSITATIDLVAVGTGQATGPIQGIAERSDNNNLLIAGLDKVAEVTKASALVRTWTATGAIGVTFDSNQTQIIVGTSSQLAWYNADGTVPSPQAKVNIASIASSYSGLFEHLEFDATGNFVVVGGAINASTAFLMRIGKNDQSYGWWRPSEVVQLSGSQAIEGFSRRGGVLTVANDAAVHPTSPNYNMTITYTDPWAA